MMTQLEAAADSAVRKHEAARARLAKVQMFMDALMMLDDARTDEETDAADAAALDKIDGATAYGEFYATKQKLLIEIDRLADARGDAYAALNSANEAA